MKNLKIFAALIAVAFAASCSQDMRNEGDTTVSLSLNIPEAMTKALTGKGAEVTSLSYAVYCNNVEIYFKNDAATFNSELVASDEITLTIGRTYDFYFWADCGAGSPYSFNGKSVDVSYGNSALSESLDGFFAKKSQTIEPGSTVSATLVRPFSQINFGTSDLAQGKALIASPKTALHISKAYSHLDLYTGLASVEVSGGANFVSAAPNEDYTYPLDGYDYLAMAYVLANPDSEICTIEYSIYDGDTQLGSTKSIDNVPFARNMRTNVYGRILTSDNGVSVELSPDLASSTNKIIFYGETVTIDNSAWDGTTMSAPTVSEPNKAIAVASAAEFAYLADIVNNGATLTKDGATPNSLNGYTIYLFTDIDLAGMEWSPIGKGTRSGSGYTGCAFKGTFNGQGHKIKNLKISSTPGADAAIGFFGVVDGGKVSNLTFEDVDINIPTSEMAAACVGMLTGGGIVENVSVSGNIVAKRGNAGIVGRMTINGTINNCVNNATISGTAANVGGIVGAAYYTEVGKTMYITDCVNHGPVTGTYYNVGGICGFSAAVVSGCSNDAVITGNGSCVAGIIGEQQNAGSVDKCENKADVVNNNSSTSSYGTGGIVGWIRYSGSTSAYKAMNIISVTNCINRGSIGTGNVSGGIVGTVYHYGEINNNKNYAASITGVTFAAGIVGNAQFGDKSYTAQADAFMVNVKNNLSTTPIENITAGCKDLFVYINEQACVTASGNTQSE